MKTVAFLCLLIAAVNAAPQMGRKITFSTETTIDYSQLKVEETEPLVKGSPEYYEAHRLVHVTPEGYEYTEPLENVMSYLKGEWDMPSYPNPSDVPATDTPFEDSEIDNDPNPENPGPENPEDLDNILDKYRNIIAEKRSVIGTDTRSKRNPNRFPYTAMGRILIGCTGTFIAPRTVLTSGHCMYNIRTDKWYSNLNFQRKKNCDSNQGVSHTWSRALTFTGYTQRHDYRYDIGIIIMRSASPVQMVFTSANSIRLETINIAGYPGDKPGRCLWASYCTLAIVGEKILQYPCDTARGMSGSAVYKYWSGPNRRIIYGVHGYGVGLTRQNLNTAIRITSGYESALRGAISRYGGN